MVSAPLTVVLSSDEEDEADSSSTGSTNRLDSVSPRPADSAHSSPAPSGGRVEAAVKSPTEQDEFGSDFFEDVNMKVTIPRRARMKDQVRTLLPTPAPAISEKNEKKIRRKEVKLALTIILICELSSLEISLLTPSHRGPRSPRSPRSNVTALSWSVGASEWELCAGWSPSPWW